MSEYNPNTLIILLVVFSCIALLCSLVTLHIVRSMGRWNSYLQLVVSLTISQLVYDISIITVPCGQANEECYFVMNVGLRVTAGLAATLWTNVISFVVLYVVWNLKNLAIAEWFWYWFFGIALFSIIMGVVLPVSLQYESHEGSPIQVWSSNIYYWTRIMSIFLNLLLYVLLTVKLSYREAQQSPHPSTLPTSPFWKTENSSPLHKFKARLSSSSKSPAQIKREQDPVRMLARRMKYYPICQLLTRLPPAFYEKTYGYSVVYEPERWTNHWGGSALYKFCSILYAITLPAAGIGFLIIFIYVTPGAFLHVKDTLNRWSKSLFGFDLFSSTSSSAYPSAYSSAYSSSLETPILVGHSRQIALTNNVGETEIEEEEAIERDSTNSRGSQVDFDHRKYQEPDHLNLNHRQEGYGVERGENSHLSSDDGDRGGEGNLDPYGRGSADSGGHSALNLSDDLSLAKRHHIAPFLSTSTEKTEKTEKTVSSSEATRARRQVDVAMLDEGELCDAIDEMYAETMNLRSKGKTSSKDEI